MEQINLKKLIGGVVFLAVLFGIFSNITYLFRNTGYDRDHVVGLQSEEKDIDAVYIGGSAAFVYWEPLKAYKDYGFTSYDLATNSVGAENILPYIKYAKEYKNPELYIIGIRAFQYYSDDLEEVGARNTSDSMDLTEIPRYELINSFLRNRKTDENTDKISYYFDIAKYHTHYDNLKSDVAWGYINNNAVSRYKGCELPATWTYMDEVTDYKTDKRTKLLPNAQKELDKILAYCDEKKLNVLFVVCPYSITKEHYAIYNTVADQVTEHGYNYINANDYYEEMGIDFAKDFYNVSHVNAYGAEKYTAFLEEYIVNYYNLPDHRNDIGYSDWNDAAVQFNEYSDSVKATVDKMISDAELAVAQGEEIRRTNEFIKWGEYVNDYRYSLISVGNGKELVAVSLKEKKLLENIGLDLQELYDANSYINVKIDPMHNAVDWVMPEIINNTVTVPIGQIQNKSEAVIDNKNGICSIKINGTEYSRKDREGLNIVVFDNYFRTVIDSVTLKKKDGYIVVVR